MSKGDKVLLSSDEHEEATALKERAELGHKIYRYGILGFLLLEGGALLGYGYALSTLGIVVYIIGAIGALCFVGAVAGIAIEQISSRRRRSLIEGARDKQDERRKENR